MAKRAIRTNPVRWGVISTAKIGWEKVIPGMMKSKDLEVRAIASRSMPTARKWAKKLGIPVAYGSYEDLLNDPEIDAIYNPLPNHLHVPLTLAAAAKGKHVLCEKPIALTAEEAATLKSAPRGIHIAEAFMVRHHPQWIKARELAQKGKLGTLRAIQCFFSYYNVDPKNVRNIADIGGGAAYDIGCYPIVTARYIFGADPLRVAALVDRDPTFGTDRTTSAVLDFGEGRHLTFTVSTQTVPYQRVNIYRDQGAARGRDSLQRAAGRCNEALPRRRQEIRWRLGKDDQAAEGRPVSARGRAVLAGGARHGSAGPWRRRRGHAGARDRRDLPVREVGGLGDGLDAGRAMAGDRRP